MKQAATKIFMLAILLLMALGIDAQVIIRFAGDTTIGSSGDGGQATAAKMNQPNVLTMDGAGNIYIGEGNGYKIRKVTPAGIISTIAGNAGTAGWTGDGGPATAAQLSVFGLAFDAGNLYIGDYANHVIRKIDPSGIITTVYGTGGVAGYTGDGGPASTAKFNHPRDIKFDAAGNMYVCDWSNHAIRKITPSGIITTIAGNGTGSYTGDGGQATAATMNLPYQLEFDATGNLFFIDGNNNCVRNINTSGIITTVVGNGTAGYSPDGTVATAAQLASPTSVTFDAAGNMYIADRGNNRIRKVTSGGLLTTITGIGASFETGDGGPATAAAINKTFDMMFDPSGNMYLANVNGHVVRKIVAVPTAAFSAPSATLCPGDCATFNNTGTGTLDSLRWTAAGATIASPIVSTTNICFPTIGTYTVTLTVHNISGSPSHSAIVNVITCPTGINNTGIINNSLQIYPNPNTGTFTINMSSAVDENATLLITDLLGKQVKKFTTITNSPTQLKPDLPKGIYFVSGITRSSHYTTKLVIE